MNTTKTPAKWNRFSSQPTGIVQSMERSFGKKLKFIFMTNGRDFIKVVEILFQPVEILLTTIKIFMMNGRESRVEQSRFSF